MPDIPCRMACQVAGTPAPKGDMIPSPVTTTRRCWRGGGGPKASAITDMLRCWSLLLHRQRL